MKTQERLRITFSILMILYGDHVTSEEDKWDCKESHINNSLQIDCSGLHKEMGVPKTLNKDVQILNLSKNVLHDIRGDSFALYKNLTSLDLSDCSEEGKYKEYEADKCFLPLTKLQHLDLSKTCFPLPPKPRPRFPKTIKTFKLQHCDQGGHDLDVSDMESLEELFCEQTSLGRFPIINNKAPLRTLDVRGSNLANATYEQIASLCHLKEVLFHIKEGDGIQGTKKYCDCLMLELWLVKAKVNTPTKLACGKPTPAVECNETFSKEASVARQKCLDVPINTTVSPGDARPSDITLAPDKSGKWWLIPLVGVIGAALLIVAALAVISVFKPEKQEEISNSGSMETEAEGDEVIEEEQSEQA